MCLYTWPLCPSAPTILARTDSNALCNDSNLLLATTTSILVCRALITYVVVFIPFATSVAPSTCISIYKLNLILNDVVTRKMWPFTNTKSTPSSSFLLFSSSRLDSAIRGPFCTYCGLFRTIFPFKMDNIGPYISFALLMS